MKPDLEKEYNASIDSKKRITIRGEHVSQHYNIKKYSNGVIVMEPREMVRPKDVTDDFIKSVTNKE